GPERHRAGDDPPRAAAGRNGGANRRRARAVKVASVSEIELLVPDTLAPERLAAVISSSGLVAEEAGAHQERRVYYDTFDGRLRAGGRPVVHEGARLTLNGVSVA